MSRDSRSVSGTVKEQAGNSKMNKSMWTQLKRELLALFFTPDEFIGWGVVAVVPAIWAIKTYKPSTIISTGPPFTSQLIALIARTFCRVTWIADFRDPWAHSPTRPREITSKLSEQINEWLEKLVIHWADHVVFVSSATADWYKKRYPFACHSTWHVISNGFAEEEFRILRASEPRNRTFTISHIGSIEYQRSPLPVFQAIKELLSEGVFMREQVKVRLIGKCGKVNNLPLQDLINQYELEGVIEMVEPVPRGIALKEMCRAHVLLLLANDQRLQIPGKVYEYIGSGRPILAIAEHDSATADLMRQIGGVVTEVQEVACIKKALAQWYHESASLQRMRDQSQDAAAERLGTFEWAVLASQYKKIIA